MFAELTSTKLSPSRVSRQSRSGLRPEPMLLVAPGHANDNHVTRHRPGAATKRPVLTCRWGPSATGGLECRWFLAGGEAPRAEEPGAERRSRASGRCRRPAPHARRRMNVSSPPAQPSA
jgi:hypothetical protein